MSNLKTYSKYVVQRSVGGREVKKEKDGSPVLGECVKTGVRISQEQAEMLNYGWDSSEKPLSFYFKEISTEDEEKAIRKEAFKKATIMFEDGKLDGMPAKNISTEKLLNLIKED